MSEGGIAAPRTVATPGPRIVMARAAKQRERILDAAEACFIRHGFHAASMAHIAQTADMSAGLIYRYFDGKAAIVKASKPSSSDIWNPNTIKRSGSCTPPRMCAGAFWRHLIPGGGAKIRR